MSKQTIILRTVIDEDWDAGTRLQVYTDRGTGTIDTSKPLLARPLEVFPGSVAANGFGTEPFGANRFGDQGPARPGTAVLDRQVFGQTPFGGGEEIIDVPVEVPAAFGKWKFVVQAIDRHGNAQSGALTEIEGVVSGTDPAPLSEFALFGYDAGTDQATFSFTRNTES